MASPSLPVKLGFLAGQIVLTLLYGTLGTIATLIHFVRLGPQKFFKKVPRSEPPPQATDPVYGRHAMMKLKSSGVSLHYVSNDRSDRPLMLFVHGYPECWYAWRYQMKHFSKNYRVVAIDQRGYGLSSKPSNVSDYKLETLARDIADVVDQLGYKSCILVGHDWGAVVSWAVSILYPQIVDKLVILNVPHTRALRQSLSLTQLRRSWYIFFYQIPFVPELLFQANDFGFLQRVFTSEPMGLKNQQNLTPEDVEVFKYTFAQDGTATAAINYYRALLRYQDDRFLAQVTVPVLIIWGCQDQALGEELADASVKCCTNAQLKKIRNASHWVQQDEPEEVNRYIEAFVNQK